MASCRDRPFDWKQRWLKDYRQRNGIHDPKTQHIFEYHAFLNGIRDSNDSRVNHDVLYKAYRGLLQETESEREDERRSSILLQPSHSPTAAAIYLASEDADVHETSVQRGQGIDSVTPQRETKEQKNAARWRQQKSVHQERTTRLKQTLRTLPRLQVPVSLHPPDQKPLDTASSPAAESTDESPANFSWATSPISLAEFTFPGSSATTQNEELIIPGLQSLESALSGHEDQPTGSDVFHWRIPNGHDDFNLRGGSHSFNPEDSRETFYLDDCVLQEPGLTTNLATRERTTGGRRPSSTSAEEVLSRDYILAFINSRGNEYFCDVDEEYLTDRFNLTGLNTEVQYYQHALDLITDVFDLDCEDEVREQIEKSARHLYGLVHARYIVTNRGLQKMMEKYKNGDFGKCPRVACDGQPLLPIGQNDTANTSPVKLYCARCEDIYNPKSQKHSAIDGAYFGTSFPHILFQVYSHLMPTKSQRRFEPRIYGFKVHASAALARWQEERKMETKDRLTELGLDTGFEEEDLEDEMESDDDDEMAQDGIDDMFEGRRAVQRAK